MEFFDKDTKRKHTTRLFLGYGLIAIVIAMATALLVFMAQGFNLSLDEGVTRNGLIFVDSHPVAAAIYLNDQNTETTSARLLLGEGRYQMALKTDGYRDWNKTFDLNGGEVLYFSYPLLIPNTIALTETAELSSPPVWAMQSPDQRWLIVQQNANSPVLTIFDLDNPTVLPILSTLPAQQLVGSGSQLGALTPLQWSDDNQHLLLRQNLNGGGYTYIVFDRENSDNSINITKRFSLPTTGQISLRDKKYDKYYYYEPATQTLSNLDLQTGLSVTPLLNNVVAYKTTGDNLVLYVTYAGAAENQADVYVLSGGDQYKLKSLMRDAQNSYLLDLAQYDHNWHYVVVSRQSNQVMLYRNPLRRAAAGNTEPIEPQLSLELTNPQYVSFSDKERFVAAQSGQNFVVYDVEQSLVYRFASALNIPAGQPAEWMDDYHFGVVADGQANILEFDGANTQALLNSLTGFKAYFDKDYRFAYSITQQADGRIVLLSGQLFVE
jgi:hypothetical protein